MRFPIFRQFRRYLGSIEDVYTYLETDLQITLKTLSTGLSKLSFADNFEGWVEADVTFASGEEKSFRNQLRERIPTQRIIVRGGEGAHLVVDGDAEWTLDQVSMKNYHVNPVTVTIVFLR